MSRYDHGVTLTLVDQLWPFKADMRILNVTGAYDVVVTKVLITKIITIEEADK